MKNAEKHSENTKKRIDSTGMGMSIRFKDHKAIAEVREFTDDIPSVPAPIQSLPLPLYTQA